MKKSTSLVNRMGRYLRHKYVDLGINSSSYRPRWIDRHSGGIRLFNRCSISFANAMHWAVDIKLRNNFLCLHPSTYTFGVRWPWYIYLSPDGTPQFAIWGFGPGFKHL